MNQPDTANGSYLTCKNCKGKIHPLEVFPGTICLPCYEGQLENSTPQDDYNTIMTFFGGKK